MLFQKTKIPGVILVKPHLQEDERGFFTRTWCEEEFEEQGLYPVLKQCSISFNHLRGTLRGMHLQAEPHGECKLIRCQTGAIYDVALDLRPHSPTYLQWEAFEISAQNRHLLYLPKGIAHGFQTLQDATEVFYQISEFYYPALAQGYRYDDPTFGIKWPIDVTSISQKDMQYLLYDGSNRRAA
jgi:dTDP-4-dehydrorhamnose 3,5-epimerase